MAGLGNLGYDVSTTNALKPLADTMGNQKYSDFMMDGVPLT
jgi:hypothetical protein